MHIPVLLQPVLQSIRPVITRVSATNLRVIDATFGYGGYTRAFLMSDPNVRVLAIDQDPVAVERARELVAEFGQERLQFAQGRFSQMSHLHASRIGDGVDAVVFDLGVSSMQIDTAERGFSFKHDGPLDMRMSQDPEIPSAADIINFSPSHVIADILKRV